MSTEDQFLEKRFTPRSTFINHACAVNNEIKRKAGLMLIAKRDELSVHATQSYSKGDQIFEESPWIRSGEHVCDWNWQIVYNYLNCEQSARSSKYSTLDSIFAQWHPVMIRTADTQDKRWLSSLCAQFKLSRSVVWWFYNIIVSHCMQSVYDDDAYDEHEGTIYVKCDEDGRPALQRGMYDVLGSIRHKCTPNTICLPSLSENSEGVLTLHADRPIQRGEEIFVSYANEEMRGLERRSYLKDSFALDCVCSVCSEK
eukprot:gene658-1107_t